MPYRPYSDILTTDPSVDLLFMTTTAKLGQTPRSGASSLTVFSGLLISTLRNFRCTFTAQLVNELHVT